MIYLFFNCIFLATNLQKHINLKKLINFKEQTKNPKTQKTQELKNLKE